MCLLRGWAHGFAGRLHSYDFGDDWGHHITVEEPALVGAFGASAFSTDAAKTAIRKLR